VVWDSKGKELLRHTGGTRENVHKVFESSETMTNLFRNLWSQEEAQDIAEYAVMLAVILVIVIGTIRLIGSHANTVFSSVASSIG
jgi:Flp pilus assembly pilin Flp